MLLLTLPYRTTDEVRALGRLLDIPAHLVGRHPFPGPGLAIRILGEVNAAQVKICQHADSIFIEEIRAAGLYDQIAQAFAALLPVKAVGVQGDRRTYEQVIVLRAVQSEDFMTADWFPFPPEVLRKISSRITNEVNGVVSGCPSVLKSLEADPFASFAEPLHLRYQFEASRSVLSLPPTLRSQADPHPLYRNR